MLDNLEQLDGADTVVAELLTEAPQVVVVATSRRPLHVAAEHEHPVPPLELPGDTSLAEAQASGAVQLFVQQAQKVRPSFTLTAENIADVAEVCRRLDGLPLAIELAAARSKLLGPGALLARLDKALELKDTSVDRPTRQRTLRETIAWSYDLLTADTQVFFRRLGVFAGGADLDAIEAVTTSDDDSGSGDVLDLVAGLVDASLVTVSDTVDTEPRFGLLETVRAYAADQLSASGEREAARERHAHHYLAVVERMNPLLETDQRMAARTRLETEHDNLREALSWALPPADKASATPENMVETGLRLCAAVADFWVPYPEVQRWLERAIERAGNRDSPELARCLQFMSAGLRLSGGDLDRAHEYATASARMCRRLGDPSRLAFALITLAGIERHRGQPAAARLSLEESLSLARESGDKLYLAHGLMDLALLEDDAHNYERSLELNREVIDLAHEIGHPTHALFAQHNIACTLRLMGEVEQAQAQMRNLIPQALELNGPDALAFLAEDYACVLADLGHHPAAVQLLAAADAVWERIGIPRDSYQQAEVDESFAKARAALTTQEWDDAYQAGRDTTVEDALTEAHAAAPTEVGGPSP